VAWPDAFGKGTAQLVRPFPCVSHSNSAPEAARSSYRLGRAGKGARTRLEPPTGFWIKATVGLPLQSWSWSVLKLPLERLKLLGEHTITAGEVLDLAYRVQHRGVIASAEPAADFGQ